jgi:phosphohistidine phosphatase
MPANRLYFAQHGLALDETENPERPLSEAGIKQTIAVARHLRSSRAAISQIFHSGKLRALQTAEIFATTLNLKAVSKLEHISPNDDIHLIEQQLCINNALYIGHLPHLGDLVSYLVTSNKKPNIISFQNSAVVCLEKTGNSYYLRWYLTPELAGKYYGIQQDR